MSNRAGRRIREARERTAAITAAATGLGEAKAYDGGNTYSQRRGWIYWPTLDTRRELTPATRKTLLRKARKFYADVGFARRIVNGLANLIGYLTPQAATNDRAWNAKAEAAFDNFAGEEFVFDRAGKYNFYTWQIQNTRLRMKDGDCLTLLTSTDSGIASTIIYEAHQIDDGDTTGTTPANLYDGVYVDKFGKHIRYRIVDPADTSAPAGTLDANDCIFYADFERPGQVRGVSALAHAVNRLQDIQEITGDWMLAIKMAAQIGYQMVRPGAAQAARGIASAIATETQGDSTAINVENLYKGGHIPQLGDGEKIELLHDDRPHPNSIELLYWINREIAWGVGVSPEVLWDITKQTGPSTRYLMAETQRWVQHEQGKLERICRRYWVYFIAKEIKAGRLPMPADPEWWKVSWTPQADQTIDIGRENQATLDNLKWGLISRTEACAKRGTDWERVYRKACEERQMMDEIAAEYGLDAEDVIPALTDQQLVSAKAEAADPSNADPATTDPALP